MLSFWRSKDKKSKTAEANTCKRPPCSQPIQQPNMNIVLLGNTGAGKSTFINGFANYTRCTNIEDAKRHKLQVPIASCFTIVDKNLHERLVKVGEWKGTGSHIGESKTRKCQHYEFSLSSCKVTLIDTPGTGDTAGLAQHEVNCDEILNYLKNFEYITAICIVLPANCSRANAAFEFCLKELFCRLPKSYAANVCFVFTHAQCSSGLWELGDTGRLVKEFMHRLAEGHNQVEIPFLNNIFYVDNEGLRYVAMLENGISKYSNRATDYAESWTKSAHSCMLLFRYAQSLTPQPTRDITLLSNASRISTLLKKDAWELTKRLKILNAEKNDYDDAITALSKCINHLEKKQFIVTKNLVERCLKYPRFVCENNNCPKTRHLGHLPQMASESCRYDYAMLTQAHYQRDYYEMCQDCGCYWMEHTFVFFEYIPPGQLIEDENVVDQIKEHKESVNVLQQKLAAFEQPSVVDENTLDEMIMAAKAFLAYWYDNCMLLNSEKYGAALSGLEDVPCPENVTTDHVSKFAQNLCKLSSCREETQTALHNMLEAMKHRLAVAPMTHHEPTQSSCL